MYSYHVQLQILDLFPELHTPSKIKAVLISKEEQVLKSYR